MNKSELKAALEQQRPRITSLYGQEQVERQIARYGQLIDDYERAFGNMDCALFSAPGRTEVGGNHTDHQHGRVLAASVNMDAAAAAGRREGEVVFYSEGFEIKPVSLADLFVHPEEFPRLVRAPVDKPITALPDEQRFFDDFMESELRDHLDPGMDAVFCEPPDGVVSVSEFFPLGFHKLLQPAVSEKCVSQQVEPDDLRYVLRALDAGRGSRFAVRVTEISALHVPSFAPAERLSGRPRVDVLDVIVYVHLAVSVEPVALAGGQSDAEDEIGVAGRDDDKSPPCLVEVDHLPAFPDEFEFRARPAVRAHDELTVCQVRVYDDFPVVVLPDPLHVVGYAVTGRADKFSLFPDRLAVAVPLPVSEDEVREEPVESIVASVRQTRKFLRNRFRLRRV